MASKPVLPWITRLGDASESFIAGHLRYFATASKADRDLGIDFHCELVEQDSPTTPFLVQAKGTQHFNSWSARVPKSTVAYWLSQLAPVFVVVFDDTAFACYWVSVEGKRAEWEAALSDSASATVALKVDRKQRLERGVDNSEFVAAVKADAIRVQSARGLAGFVGDGYLKQLPHVPRTSSEHLQIREGVRAGLYSLTQEALAQGDIPRATEYCDFLANFDPNHYNHFLWQADLREQAGDLQGAVSSYHAALDICERDDRLPQGVQAILTGWFELEIDRLTTEIKATQA